MHLLYYSKQLLPLDLDICFHIYVLKSIHMVALMRLVFRFVKCILKAAENTFESQVHPENTMERAVCTEINRELTEKYDLINQLHRSSNKSSIHIP